MNRIMLAAIILAGCSGEPATQQNETLVIGDDTDTLVADTSSTEVAIIMDTTVSFNVQSYYMNLPGELFMCDGTGNEDNTQFRLSAIEFSDIENGYIVANPQGFYELEVMLFKDQKNEADHIISQIDCGMGCMCNDISSFIADNATGELIPDWSIFPEDEVENLKGGYYSLILPQHGTTITVYDFEVFNNPEADAMPLFLLTWQYDHFEKQDIVFENG